MSLPQVWNENDQLVRPLYAADLAELPDSLPSGGVRYELHAGELIIMPPSCDEHGSIESPITTSLVVQGQQTGLGKVRSGEVGILISRDPDTVLGADVVFLPNRQLPVQVTPEGYLATIPALVVEIASKNDTRAKIERKVRQYLAAGVEAVWVAYPRTRTVVIHKKDEDPTPLSGDEPIVFHSDFPERSIPVSSLFE